MKTIEEQVLQRLAVAIDNYKSAGDEAEEVLQFEFDQQVKTELEMAMRGAREALATPVKAPTPITAEEFLVKFPDCALRGAWLCNLACPECGQREAFIIGNTNNRVRVEDVGGPFPAHGSAVRWDSSAYCECGGCDKSETVADFTIEGLDHLIHERWQHPAVLVENSCSVELSNI